MNDFNYQFFEEFTKLDKLCVSVYQAEGGVLGYIEQMRSVSAVCADTIPNWTAELEQLHRYRTVYQALSQSGEAFNEQLCDREDLDWLRDFYNRIMDRKDPLALIQLSGYRAEDGAIQRLEDERAYDVVIQPPSPRDRYVNGPVMVWVIVLAVIVTCIFCMLVLPRL